MKLRGAEEEDRSAEEEEEWTPLKQKREVRKRRLRHSIVEVYIGD